MTLLKRRPDHLPVTCSYFDWTVDLGDRFGEWSGAAVNWVFLLVTALPGLAIFFAEWAIRGLWRSPPPTRKADR